MHTIDSKTELDNIFCLLSLSIVHRDFQDSISVESRGLNIGCVIVNANNDVVYHGLNSITSGRDLTQHGETRAILGYLSQSKPRNSMVDYTVYTTLEPCAMCSGMMVQVELSRVVSVLKELPFKSHEGIDVSYGQTLERLTENIEGFGPYPLFTKSDFMQHSIANEFLKASSRFQKEHMGKHGVGHFLASSSAKEIFAKAEKAFINFKPTHKDNIAPYQLGI